MKYFVVAGIGTEIGKTFISSILVEALEADYWKPIQAGNLDCTDTDFIKHHISNKKTVCHPEAYRLSAPMSPHAAAEAEGILIELEKLEVPQTKKSLIIELAGGLMVPLNNNQLNIDLLQQWRLPLILVSENYLGSINHTLLSVEVLKSKGIHCIGIIFNGNPNPASEEFIMNYTGMPCLANIGKQTMINKDTVSRLTQELKAGLKSILT
ncbi:dethiobiotin synthase [Daejeonella oryzae]|uniref:dethiobiotin synthase n=1 Tax=Daejeonella oryzae TaxID=1122943 RepID=UPI0004185DA8|nr:dethiobiotin synthase [Daejeonella oryzae]